jgi:hypothetical protein
MSNTNINPAARQIRHEAFKAENGAAWAAIEELSGGHLVSTPEATPSLLVIRDGDEVSTRWFGQKLPKNAIPVGVVDAGGKFVAGSGVELSHEQQARVAALHGLNKSYDGTVEFSYEEISSIIRGELTELAKEKHSDATPPWSRRLGLAISQDDLRGIFEERRGRITDDAATVVDDYDKYDVLDLCAWMAENHQLVSTDQLAHFLYGGTRFTGSTWIRIVWVRMILAAGLDQKSMFNALMAAHNSLAD